MLVQGDGQKDGIPKQGKVSLWFRNKGLRSCYTRGGKGGGDGRTRIAVQLRKFLRYWKLLAAPPGLGDIPAAPWALSGEGLCLSLPRLRATSPSPEREACACTARGPVVPKLLNFGMGVCKCVSDQEDSQYSTLKRECKVHMKWGHQPTSLPGAF